MSERMNVFIGNGPSDKPNIWNLSILAEPELYKRKFDQIFDSSRTMRHNFMEKYHQPFVSDAIFLLILHPIFQSSFNKQMVERQTD